MTAKKKSGPGGVPWSVIAAGLHVVGDVVTRASCPRCSSRVVLYVCPSCKRLVRPKRQNPLST